MNLHPKIKASSLAALAVALLALLGELADAYPGATWARGLLALVALVGPLVAGYAKAAGGWEPAGAQLAGLDVDPPPAGDGDDAKAKP